MPNIESINEYCDTLIKAKRYDIMNENVENIKHMSQIKNTAQLISFFKKIYRDHDTNYDPAVEYKNMMENPDKWNSDVWLYDLGKAGVTENIIKNIPKTHKLTIEDYIDLNYYNSEYELKYKQKSKDIIKSITGKCTSIASDGGGSEFFITDDNKIYYYDRDYELYNTPLSIKTFVKICREMIK